MVAISPWHRFVVDGFRLSPLFAVALGAAHGPSLPAQAESPSAQEAAVPARTDLIRLQNGNEIEGVILADGESSVTMRIAHGQEVEIPKSAIAKLVRRTRPTDTPEASTKSIWPVRHEWFQLRNVDGRLVGKLYYHVRPQRDGGAQLEQQWTFLEGGRKSFVSRIEVVDSQREPKSFLYREAVSRLSDDRVLRERLVRGEIKDGSLLLSTAGTDGRSKRSIPFPSGNSFPLAVAESLRRGDVEGALGYAASVYDPLDGVFELRRYRISDRVPAPRTVDASVRKRGVRLIESVEHGRTRREWIGAAGRIDLIEVNGVHLVAEPVSEQTALELGAFEKARSAPRVMQFRGHDLWLPRATWAFGRVIARGRCIELVPPVDDVSVRVRWLGNETTGEAILQGAGERLLTIYRLENKNFHETGQELVTLGDLPGLRIDGFEKDAHGRKRPAQIWLREAADGWLAITVGGSDAGVSAISAEVYEVIASLRPSPPKKRAATFAGPGR